MRPNAFKLHPQLAADSHHLGELPLCTLLLLNNSNYPWFVLVPRADTHVTEIFELTKTQQEALVSEISGLSEYCKKSFGADKVNVAAFGNQVLQLHIHVIMRFTGDHTFPKPAFNDTRPPAPYTQTELEEIRAIVATYLQAI